MSIYVYVQACLGMSYGHMAQRGLGIAYSQQDGNAKAKVSGIGNEL